MHTARGFLPQVTDPLSLALMALAVIWMTTQAGLTNRLTGVPVARWRPMAPPDPDGP